MDIAGSRGRFGAALAQPLRVTAIRPPAAHQISNWLTEGLIYFMVVLSPWIFGSTLRWTIWMMNAAGYLIGALWLFKWAVSWQTGWRPARWGEAREAVSLAGENRLAPAAAPLAGVRAGLDPIIVTRALGALTAFFLIYCLIGAANFRATYRGWHIFEWRDCIFWLPHSYDRLASWFSFWTYLSLAGVFWATRDWLLEKTSRERARRRHSSSRRAGTDLAEPEPREGPSRHFPARLERLLWVLSINGALLGLEGILQRLDGTNKLLWINLPLFNHDAVSQFGPYAYRANAASYFNLVWPVCLGFWFVLRENARALRRGSVRLGQGSHSILLPGAVLMAGCPIIATTRGGAVVAMVDLVLTGFLLWRSGRRAGIWYKIGLTSFVLVILVFAGVIGGKDLFFRFETVFTDDMSHRPEIYKNAQQIARDYPWFGTGAGSFGAMYQMYRSPDQSWAGYVHDDWLEARIDLGWIGFVMLLAMLGLVAARWFAGGGLPARWVLTGALWIALGGCLLHSKFDFPFEIYSILFLFVLLCSILFCGGRPHAEIEIANSSANP